MEKEESRVRLMMKCYHCEKQVDDKDFVTQTPRKGIELRYCNWFCYFNSIEKSACTSESVPSPSMKLRESRTNDA